MRGQNEIQASKFESIIHYEDEHSEAFKSRFSFSMSNAVQSVQ